MTNRYPLHHEDARPLYLEIPQDEYDRINSRIAELEEERRWSKFPEEKPKWGEEVLVLDEEGDQHIVRFSHDMKWISWGKMNTCESNCVKFWMPLPEQPEVSK
jgi:hypothetical protein